MIPEPRTSDLPGYAAKRSELVAKLALSRLEGAEIFENDGAGDRGWDFHVKLPDGRDFFVEVKSYSSFNTKNQWRVKQDSLEYRFPKSLGRYRNYPHPIFLWLIDADTEKGYYLRLDRLNIPGDCGPSFTGKIPPSDDLSAASLERMINGL